MTEAEIIAGVLRELDADTSRDHLLNMAYASSTPDEDRVANLLDRFYQEALEEYGRAIDDRHTPVEPAPDGHDERGQPPQAGGTSPD